MKKRILSLMLMFSILSSAFFCIHPNIVLADSDIFDSKGNVLCKIILKKDTDYTMLHLKQEDSVLYFDKAPKCSFSVSSNSQASLGIKKMEWKSPYYLVHISAVANLIKITPTEDTVLHYDEADFGFNSTDGNNSTAKNSNTKYTYTISENSATITNVREDTDEELFIPENLDGYKVTAIDSGAFRNCSRYLKRITIPNSVSEIKLSAFENCKMLESIYIESENIKIHDGALRGAYNLKEIIITKKNDTYATIDGNLINKKDNTFLQYTVGKNETMYTIPENITTIAGCSFEGSMFLKTISIPSSVETIEYESFYNCKNIDTIYYAGTEEQWKKVVILPGNDCFNTAKIYFNSAFPEKDPTFVYDEDDWQIASTQTIGQTPPLLQTVVNENTHNINVVFNGEKVVFTNDTGFPQMRNERVYVPFRIIFNLLGYKNDDIKWTSNSEPISAYKSRGSYIEFKIGSDTVYVQDNSNPSNPVAMTTEKLSGSVPYIDNSVGRTMVPVRLIAESVGAFVDWDGKTQTVNIRMPDKLYVVKTIKDGKPKNTYVGTFKNSDGSAYYGEATKTLKAFEDYNVVDDANSSNGYLAIYHPIAREITADYDLTYKGEWELEHAYISANGDISSLGISEIWMTKVNNTPYVNIEHVAKAEGAVINNNVIDDTNSSQISKNSVKGISVGSIDAECTKNKATFVIYWETDIPTDNCKIEVKPEKDKYNKIDRTVIKHEPNNTFQSATVYFTYPEATLEDVWMKAYITLDDQTYEKSFFVHFKTNAQDEITKKEQEINNKINAIWKKVHKALIEQRNSLYSKICDHAYIINGTDTNTIQALKIFFGQKYFEYVKKHEDDVIETFDESAIMNYVFGKVKDNGAISSGTKGDITLDGVKYSISVVGYSFGSLGGYRVIVNNSEYIVNSSYDAVKYEMNNYMDQLEGMFDEALDEVWAETISDVGTTFYGLDNLNKVAIAWVDEKFWGTNNINDFIEISFKGLNKKHDELTKLCTSTQDAIDELSSAKKNPTKNKLDKAFSCVNELENVFGGWKSILQ